jgi:hypothetical protein|tara:strand:- start:1649 stop:2443 length:795 start_codon:yes stop_codon:yes gene_type:complete
MDELEQEMNMQEIQTQSAQTNLQMAQNHQTQQALGQDLQEGGIIREQLDISEELIRLENLLRGKILREDSNGELKWTNPKNTDQIILNENGVHLIINALSFYINKNTLLSNYDEDTILHKMEDFATSLADALFMNSEKYFLYLTPEECQARLIERLKRKQQEIIYHKELYEEEIDKKAIWKKLVNEIDDVTEREKIREQEIKNKLKNFDLLMRVVQDTVHSTYLRAFRGEERRTLRKHIHVSETIGNQSPQQPSRINPLNWGKR